MYRMKNPNSLSLSDSNRTYNLPHPLPSVEVGRGKMGHNDHEFEVCLSYTILDWKLLPLKLTIIQQKMHSLHGSLYDIICSHHLKCYVTCGHTVIWLVPGKVMLHNDLRITG